MSPTAIRIEVGSLQTHIPNAMHVRLCGVKACNSASSHGGVFVLSIVGYLLAFLSFYIRAVTKITDL
jgi:hypothetical protein